MSTPAGRPGTHRGDLDEVGERLFARGIAVSEGGDGRSALVRANSVIVDGRFDQGRRRSIERAVGEFRNARIKPVSRRQRVDLQVVEFDPEQRGEHRRRRWTVEPVAEIVERLSEFGARPNHVLLAEQSMTGSPGPLHQVGDLSFPGHVIEATDPAGEIVSLLLNTSQPADAPPLRQPLKARGRRRPRVLVVDTGLRTRRGNGKRVEHPDLTHAVRIDPPWTDDPDVDAKDHEDEATADGFPDLLDYGAGHGTFVAGVVRQQCPDAEITPVGALTSFCDGDEASVVAALTEARGRVESGACEPFDICVMSLGGYYTSDDPGILADVWPDLVGDMLVVAAAGNADSDRRFFPAALDGVVAVGALDHRGKGWYSNYGGWVDACAPGIDVVSTYFTDFAEALPPGCALDPRTYAGWATWSGTSFTAPKVAGVLAQEMYLTGCSAHDAWAAMSAPERFRLPDLGVVVNV